MIHCSIYFLYLYPLCSKLRCIPRSFQRLKKKRTKCQHSYILSNLSDVKCSYFTEHPICLCWYAVSNMQLVQTVRPLVNIPNTYSEVVTAAHITYRHPIFLQLLLLGGQSQLLPIEDLSEVKFGDTFTREDGDRAKLNPSLNSRQQLNIWIPRTENNKPLTLGVLVRKCFSDNNMMTQLRPKWVVTVSLLLNKIDGTPCPVRSAFCGQHTLLTVLRTFLCKHVKII